MESSQCIDLRDGVGNSGNTRLGLALNFVNVIGELRAYETRHQHIEAFGFGMSQQ